MAKYLVVENTPGYLPEGIPSVFDTKVEAQMHMLTLKRELIELDYRVSGSYKDGWYYAVYHDNDLGRVIEMMEAKDDGF
jgi:hypothetical protein